MICWEDKVGAFQQLGGGCFPATSNARVSRAMRPSERPSAPAARSSVHDRDGPTAVLDCLLIV